MKSDTEEAMLAFDQLPGELRQLLAEAQFNWDPRPMLEAYRAGAPLYRIRLGHERYEQDAAKKMPALPGEVVRVG